MVVATQTLTTTRRPSDAILPFFLHAVKLCLRSGFRVRAGCGYLKPLEMLGSVGDPRRERGKQHDLAFVLAVCVVAMLSGAKGYSEIARKAKDMSQCLLAKLGAEWDWFRL